MKPTFFSRPADFRKWLEKNHAKKKELIVGFHKVHTGTPCITWGQSVDEALCFGWIDGVRTSIDSNTYQIRFTPRNPSSIWSAVNIKKITELTEKGLMHEAGLNSFNSRVIANANIYSHEKSTVAFSSAFEKQFKANKKAWQYFQALAASYQKSSVNWVMSAKQEPTRLKRLTTLIADSEAGTNMWKDNKYKK